MLKRRYFSVCASLLFFLALCIAPKVSAIETRSYLVTDFREFTQAPHRTIVWYHTYVYLPWKSGKVVLSGSPDGTKPVNIGWKIELINEKSNTRKFSYNNSDSIYTCVDVDMPPLNITHLFLEGDNGFLIRFVSPCYNANNRLDIGPVYIVHFDDYEPSDEPFLDLPWDYAADGERFEEVALRMSSYFDHEYPLLSTNLREPDEVSSSMVVFNDSERSQKYYSSHDGYDYAKDSGAILNDPVLAAAPGWATYHYSKYIGNAIFIDHENGYQSRYYHMNRDNLVTLSSVKKWVDDRQQLGTVGFTGNVRPVGSKGAHIHFMVVKDKDGNGSFDDNIPDGIVDPFG
ncbi:MAG: M23 family metallopeptidase [Candidatus Roizmanbacteria bacterium]|nr:M23 family metallopeptidase [Candidatus Roizmanbacteria bacterium]